MSTLNSMSILGVRSFPTDRQQIIQFGRPLTLILGCNGTGKTTTIEALQYVTTGELPPNAKTNGAFVHDPKLVNEVEVKAQVKLKFKDVNGKPVVATRSLVATQKQKTVTTRSLDGTIDCVDDKGQKVTLTTKCGEMDREMVSLLGVSKAILNHVIFCHQEESNWPLSESRALKIRFDEIFAATRYIKALTTLNDLRKSHDKQAETYEIELKYLEANKQRAEQLNLELEKAVIRQTSSLDQVKKIEAAMRPVEERLREIKEKESSIVAVQKKLAEKETEMNVEKKTYNELEGKIKVAFTGSTGELKQKLRNFSREIDENTAKRNEIDTDMKKLKADASKLVANKTDVSLRLGKLTMEATHHKNRVKQRDEQAKSLCQRYKLKEPQGIGQLTAAHIDQIGAQMQSKIGEFKSSHQSLKESYSSQEKGLEQQLNSKREENTKLVQTETICNKQIGDHHRERQSIMSELVRVEVSASRLQLIEADVRRKERDVQRLKEQVNADELQSEIKQLADRHSTLNSKMRELDDELMLLHSQAEVQAELESARKDIAFRQEAVRKLTSKHEDTIKHLLGSVPTESASAAVDKFLADINSEIRHLRDDQMKLKVKLAKFESDRNSRKEELEKREAELNSSITKMYETCGQRDLEVSLSTLDASIKKLQDEKGSATGYSTMYKSYIEKLRRKNACCPLCQRNFEDDSDVQDLINDLENKLRILPQEMVNKEKQLKDQQLQYNTMLELKPVKNLVNSLKQKDIPDLKGNLQCLENSIEDTKEELAQIDDKLDMKQNDEVMATTIVTDMVKLDQNTMELKKAEKKLAAATSRLKGQVSGRTVASVSEEKSTLRTELSDVQTKLADRQQKYNDYVKQVGIATEEYNKLVADQNKIFQDQQQISRLEEKKATLGCKMSELRKEVDQIKSRLAPLEAEIGELEREREALLLKKEKSLEESQRVINEITARSDELKSIHREVTLFLDSRNPVMLQDCQKELEDVDCRLKKAAEKEHDLTERRSKLSQLLDNQQTEVRGLQDLLDLRKKQELIEGLKEDVDGLKRQLGGYDVETLLRERKSVLKKIEDMTAERSGLEGAQKEVRERIRSLQKDLASDDYKEAGPKYKKKLIEATTTRVAMNDIKKYSAALDSAIMQYHQQKMIEINKIMKDLWIQTYRGNDIDYIEIRSEANTSRGGTHSYRVVMVKEEVAQDMRGRCSAGQKVLASLIIRLALAETFCINCGILALDEPTTNLDRPNVESLADALAQIVESRSGVRGFQLVVITHDEDFVDRLGRSASTDHYYRVSKDDETASAGSMSQNRTTLRRRHIFRLSSHDTSSKCQNNRLPTGEHANN